MCCWVRDVADNTDICYSDMRRQRTAPRVSNGFAIYEGDEEGDAHCHGYAWSDGGPDDWYKGNALFYISMYDHMTQRQYFDNVPGSPMCACVEQMPTVTRADCTELVVTQTTAFVGGAGNLDIVVSPNVSIEYQACQAETNNDLSSYYQRLVDEGHARPFEQRRLNNNFVVGEGNCPAAIDNFLASKGWGRA